ALEVEPIARKLGNAGAEGHRGTRAVGRLEHLAAHVVQDAVQARHTVAGTHPVHADDELFAAPAGNDVFVAKGASQGYSESTQYLVARGVAESVVHLFEVIDVDDDERECNV